MTVLVDHEKIFDEAEPETILTSLFGRSPAVRLIDFFLDHPLNDFMQKEIAERMGMNKRTIRKNLPSLLDNGVISMTRTIGKAKLFKLNGKSPIIQKIRDLEKTASLEAAQEELTFE